jgi:uncharacterized protein (DUF1800 family)
LFSTTTAGGADDDDDDNNDSTSWNDQVHQFLEETTHRETNNEKNAGVWQVQALLDDLVTRKEGNELL